jgi:hypothetical protein
MSSNFVLSFLTQNIECHSKVDWIVLLWIVGRERLYRCVVWLCQRGHQQCNRTWNGLYEILSFHVFSMLLQFFSVLSSILKEVLERTHSLLSLFICIFSNGIPNLYCQKIHTTFLQYQSKWQNLAIWLHSMLCFYLFCVLLDSHSLQSIEQNSNDKT